jgi:hypothetical protein
MKTEVETKHLEKLYQLLGVYNIEDAVEKTYKNLLRIEELEEENEELELFGI